MIQLLTKNEEVDFAGEGVVINSLHTPRSLDEFEVNIIDLNNEELWRNNGQYNDSIDDIRDFKSISQMIHNSERTKILILLPQNIKYFYLMIRGAYQNHIELKDMIFVLNCILSNLCILFEDTSVMTC